MIQRFEFEAIERQKFNRIQDELDEAYHKKMKQYWEHKHKLQQEKELFIKENPDFPNPDILFLNVVAPPQRLIINIVD